MPCVVVERGGFTSRLRHHEDGGLEQWVEAVGEPFSPVEVLGGGSIGCDWVILAGQAPRGLPARDHRRVLAEAGHRVCIDGQGLCRGDAPGPVRLLTFLLEAVGGVSILKLNPGRGRGGRGGGLAAEVAARAGERRRSSSRSVAMVRWVLRPTADALGFDRGRDLRRPHRRR